MGMSTSATWEISWSCSETTWISDLFTSGANHIILSSWWLKITVTYLYSERDEETKIHTIESLGEDMRLFMLHNNTYQLSRSFL